MEKKAFDKKTQEVRGRLVYVDESGTEVDSVEVAMPRYYLKSVLRAARLPIAENAVKWAVVAGGMDKYESYSTREQLAAGILDNSKKVRRWVICGRVLPKDKIEDALGDLINSCHLLIARLAEVGEIPTEELNKR